MIILNYDNNKLNKGQSVYGEQYQVEINSVDEINQSVVDKINQLIKQVKVLKRQRIIRYKTNHKTVSSKTNNSAYYEPYNRDLVKIIKNNEMERKQQNKLVW